MRRSEFEHVIRSVCAVLGVQQIWVVGSQAILGSFSETELPKSTVSSFDTDFYVPGWARSDEDTIEAALGEVSQFAMTYGYYADPVSENTANPPSGWQQRVVAYYNENTNGCTAWCLEPYDLALSKLLAGRDKDIQYVAELIGADLIRPNVLLWRLDEADNYSDEQKTLIRAHINRILSVLDSGPSSSTPR